MQSTLLPLSNYFFVPGQRFRELYYWDTYWVVKGLLVSNMLKSAKVGMKHSFLKKPCMLRHTDHASCSGTLHTGDCSASCPSHILPCSAQVVVLNLISLLKKHGFVPNGSRLYYLNRRCWALDLFMHCCTGTQGVPDTLHYGQLCSKIFYGMHLQLTPFLCTPPIYRCFAGV